MTATPGRAAVPAESADRSAIEELLRQRAAAVRTGDEDLFRETIGGTAGFVARQMRAFQSAAQVDFSTYELRARWEALGDLARPMDAGRYPGADAVAIPLTEERYRIGRFDESDAVEDVFFTFVKRDDGWRIESDDDLAGAGFVSARHPWDFGEVTPYSERGMVVLMSCGRTPSCEATAQRILGVAAAGRVRAGRYWNEPAPEHAVIIVPGSTRELKRILQATFDIGEFIAFALSFVEARQGEWFTAPRIVVGPGALAGEPPERVLHIFAHEMLHVITREASGPFVPLFVEEGFAEHAGTAADPARLAYLDSFVASGAFDRRLPENYEFTTGEDVFVSYQEGLSAVSFMIERWGLRRFNRLYADLGARRIVPGTLDYHLDDAFRESLGLSYRAFERRWASSVRLS